MNETTYIIILNYNGWRDTIECLESVLKSDYENFKIVVCDNASGDDSVDRINAWIFENDYGDKIKLLTAQKNNGYNAGNNIGLRYALEKSNCKYFWILNNDTEVGRQALKQMIECQKETNCSGVGSVLMEYDQREIIQCAGSLIDYENFGLTGVGSGKIFSDLESNLKIDVLPGASFLITRSIIEKIGLFDENYFLYCEELELAARIKAVAEKITYAKDSFVYHKGGRSTDQIKRSGKMYQNTRSWTIFLKRHRPQDLDKFKNHVKNLYMNFLKHLKFQRARAIYKGYIDGLAVV